MRLFCQKMGTLGNVINLLIKGKLRDMQDVNLFAETDMIYRKAKDGISTDAKELEVG